ncbi:MAG: hypothetical protein HW414_256 [Dehalococcoidia bacterium]|nr:hypothetical protein [Dehalococcoidia bacterium]
MPREIIHSDELPRPPGCYSYGTKVRGGTLLFMGGAIPLDKNGKLVGEGDMKAQLTQTIDNIRLALKAAGATLSDIVNARIFTTNIEALLPLQEWRCQQFPELFGRQPGDETAPSATMIEVKRLFDPRALVEIEVFAHVK